jgi:hypothetical protein
MFIILLGIAPVVKRKKKIRNEEEEGGKNFFGCKL